MHGRSLWHCEAHVLFSRGLKIFVVGHVCEFTRRLVEGRLSGKSDSHRDHKKGIASQAGESEPDMLHNTCLHS